MILSVEYKRQFAWRSWSEVMGLLPPLGGRTVLDLGCGIGDQAAALAARGARVIGFDTNQELLAAAQSRAIPNAEFRSGDLRAFHDVGLVDGIWCSFAAAYVPELGPTLARWRQHLNPGDWVALTEVDDLFAHQPVEALTSSLLKAYACDALTANRYDFHMGRKLRAHLEQAGFTIAASRTLLDQELSFDGPADSEVLDAWKSRLNRMKLLKDFCGAAFGQVRDDFLAALSRPNRHSLARVYFCIATL
jgi:SAM-dependent methyltransferase